MKEETRKFVESLLEKHGTTDMDVAVDMEMYNSVGDHHIGADGMQNLIEDLLVYLGGE